MPLLKCMLLIEGKEERLFSPCFKPDNHFYVRIISEPMNELGKLVKNMIKMN